MARFILMFTVNDPLSDTLRDKAHCAETRRLQRRRQAARPLPSPATMGGLWSVLAAACVAVRKTVATAQERLLMKG